MLPLLAPPHFRIIAHRGASGYAPENTASAFRLAYRMGAREFELDLQRSQDGEIVLCHESSLARFGYPGLDIEQLRWRELSRLDMGSWFSPHLYSAERLMRLRTLLDEYERRVQYHIELKKIDLALIQTFLKTIAEYGCQPNIIVTSFSLDALLAVQQQSDQLRLGWLVRAMTPEILARTRQQRFFQLCPRIGLLTARQVEQIHANQLEARAWGINGTHEENLALAQKAIDIDCDGVTINWPDWIKNRSSTPVNH